MLIGARQEFATSFLPYDAEVEYLESTGTQYIDTGFVLSSNCRCVVDALMTGVASGTSSYIFGVFGGGTNFGINISIAYDDLYCVWAGNSTLADPEYKNRNVVDLSRDGLFENGVKIFTPTGSFAGTKSAYLFWANGTGQGKAIGKIYSCKMYDGDGVLVRDFIPVRKGPVGYLYDRVSGRLFGNQGTGDFTCGPDVVPVEYIESHGTEYINTGVVPTSLTKWDIDAQFTSSDYGQIMGRGGDPALNPRFAFGLDIQSSGHGLTWYCGMGDVNTWNGIFDTFRHAFSLDAPHKTFTIDTTSYNVPLSSIGDTTIMQLFARFVNGSVQNFCKAKIFKSSIIDNGLLVHSFRPVRVGTEGAMMDVLTRRIYRNQGTGAFSYGNDLKYPILAA